ncbi:SpoIIE family protein phosphatase [Pseudokineococcus lusitanus]|uniref:GAF domain-containing protein n=1 Tax=Pseudokineococcus lusitanus TaxID=763993 RepID=A0A3N1G8N1_9ACTN|nr:SpoIIE family protein phosphatase [Pseudokineococcus lusitanus]ROP26538.1 GAF domain-containing protein [Pseudokineococcus lusitanus]
MTGAGDDGASAHDASGPADDAARAAAALRSDRGRTAAARRLTAATADAVATAATRRRLDVLARWAAQLVGSASARVVLLDDLQTRVGAAGPQPEDLPAYGDRTADGPLDLAEWLCARTAASGRTLVVHDTGTDARVRHLWPVTDGGVGAYLGAPLLDAEGRAVGAVCAFDAAARTWTTADVDLLQQVADSTAAELELAALAAEHRQSRLLLDLTVAAAELGTFDLDLVSGELEMNERLLELSGLDPRTFGGRPEDVYAHIHPEDREATVAAVTEATTHGGDYRAEYRIVLPDGTVRWVAARGATLPGPQGSAPVRLLGAALDITGVRAAATRTEQILDAMAVGYLAMDGGWVVTFANAQAVRALGRPREELVGGVIWDLFPATAGTEFEAGYRRAAKTGRPVTFDAYYPAPLDAWYEVRATPEGDGVALYFLDITARKRAQQAAEGAAARLALLAAVTRELTSSPEDPEAAVGALARLVVPELADWCLVSLLDDDAPAVGPARRARGRRATEPSAGRREHRGLRDVGSWHHDEELRGTVRDYAAHRLDELDGSAPVWRALREDRHVVVDDATATLTAAMPGDGPGKDLLRRLAPSSGAVFLLRGRGRVVGLLSLFQGPDRAPLTADELATAADVADRAGTALDSARLYRQQRDLAAGLQQSLLTDPPQPDGAQVVVRYVPAAEAAQVGGDWYDAFTQPGGAAVVVIGDVIGHDTRAAAAMSQVRGALRTLGATSDDTPARLLTRTDEAMAALGITTTATALVVRLERVPGGRGDGVTRVRWSNAGHPPAVVVRPDGAVMHLAAPRSDLLLGVLPSTDRSDHEVVLEPGSTLLLFTDGLVERRDRSLRHGLDRLDEVVAGLATEEADLDGLVDGLLARMLPPQPEDDVAVLAVRLDAGTTHRP